MIRALKFNFLFLLSSVLFSTACYAAEPLPATTQAQVLLKAGKAAEAFALLAPLQFDLAGDEGYDYLLGVAALDSQEFNMATFAFERVLIVNPNNAGARMDMARAYFALNDFSRAEEEFKIVLRLNPPELVKQIALKYLSSIEQQHKSRDPSLTGYAEGSVGYDTNITSVTSDFTTAIFQTYGLPGFRPTGNAVLREDSYLSLGGGLTYILPVDTQKSWFFGLDAKQRNFLTDYSYDSTTLGAQAGFNRIDDQDTYRFSLNFQRFLQKGEALRTTLDNDVIGFTGSWQRMLNPSNQLGMFAQYSELRYADTASSNTNLLTLGANLVHLLAAPYQPVVMLGVFHIDDNAVLTSSSTSDASKETWGVRLAGQMTLNQEWEPYAMVSFQQRADNNANVRVVGKTGEDALADITLGVRWKLNKEWTVRPQISHTYNYSNIPLYVWNRTDFAITFRKDFR